MSKISTKLAHDRITQAAKGGRPFYVKFTKKSDGSEREMICQIGNSDFVTGKGPAYDAREKGLLTVFDLEAFINAFRGGKEWEEAGKAAYRSIPIDNIIDMKVGGLDI